MIPSLIGLFVFVLLPFLDTTRRSISSGLNFKVSSTLHSFLDFRKMNAFLKFRDKIVIGYSD